MRVSWKVYDALAQRHHHYHCCTMDRRHPPIAGVSASRRPQRHCGGLPNLKTLVVRASVNSGAARARSWLYRRMDAKLISDGDFTEMLVAAMKACRMI